MKRALWVVLLTLLLIPAVPGLADARDGHRGGHGYRGGKGHGGGHGSYVRHRGHRSYGKRGHYYGGHHRRHHRHHGAHYGYSIYLGPGWYAPWYPAYAYPYPYPYRYETRVIVEDPVYVERPDAEVLPAPPAQAYWHYCESEGGYYPDVERCPEEWIKVPPRPE